MGGERKDPVGTRVQLALIRVSLSLTFSLSLSLSLALSLFLALALFLAGRASKLSAVITSYLHPFSLWRERGSSKANVYSDGKRADILGSLLSREYYTRRSVGERRERIVEGWIRRERISNGFSFFFLLPSAFLPRAFLKQRDDKFRVVYAACELVLLRHDTRKSDALAENRRWILYCDVRMCIWERNFFSFFF